MGSLAPKQTIKLTATFQPQAADVYSAVAVCSYGEKEHCSTKSMQLKGIGKYPHITVKCSPGKAVAKKSPPQEKVTVTHELGDTVDPADVRSGEGALREILVDFRAVAVGAVVEKWIEIANVSPVSTPLVPTNAISTEPMITSVSLLLCRFPPPSPSLPSPPYTFLSPSSAAPSVRAYSSPTLHTG